MSDFSEDEDDVFIKNDKCDEKSDNIDDEEDDLDVLAAGRRWDPLGEEKEIDETASDCGVRDEG